MFRKNCFFRNAFFNFPSNITEWSIFNSDIYRPYLQLSVLRSNLKKGFLAFFSLIKPIKCQYCPHIETSQLICKANQLTGFYMRQHWQLMA